MEPHFLIQMISLEVPNIRNYKLFGFQNFLEEELAKSLADEVRYFCKFRFNFCKGEQRPKYFIYQNFDVSVLLLSKTDFELKVCFKWM